MADFDEVNKNKTDHTNFEKEPSVEELLVEIESISRQIIKIYAEIANIKPQKNSYSEIFCDKNIYNGDSIIREIDLLRISLKERQEENEIIFKRNFTREDIFLELIILEHQSLFVTLIERFNFNNNEFDGILKDSYTFKSVSFLCYLLNLMINNLIAIQKLFHLGLNHQINVLLRNYIELSEISIAILVNETFFITYKSEPENKKEINNKWQLTKPSMVHKIIENEYRSIEGLHKWWIEISKIRNSLYSKTSGYVHGEYFNVIIEAFPKELNEDNVRLAAMGMISDNLKSTLSETLIFSKIFINNIIIFLVKNHNLHFNRFGQNGLDHVYLNSVNTYMFNDYVEKIK